MGFDFLNRT